VHDCACPVLCFVVVVLLLLFCCCCALTLLLLRYPKESEGHLRRRARALGVEAQLVFSDFVESSEENWLRLWRGADAVLDTTVYARGEGGEGGGSRRRLHAP
jgi:hypothetical protein